MMEESSDEQPEIVTKEEAEQAEKEASQSASRSGSATPVKAGSPGPGISSIPAPSPLPAFLTSSSTPTVPATSPVKLPSQTQSETTKPSPVPASLPTVTTPAVPLQTMVPSVKPVQTVTPPTKPVQTYSAPGPIQTPLEASVAISVPSGDGCHGHSHGPPSSTGSGGIFEWISNSQLVSKVMEKTKSSVESVITTLDPGMKEVIYSGGDINVVVTSIKENKVGAVREAFQHVFGRATVQGEEGQATTAAQPVGFTAGLKGAEDRIQNLRQNAKIEEGQAVVSVEGFIVELLPDRWYEMSCLVLQDPQHRIDLQTFSQPTPIPTEYVLTAQDRTPADYPLRWSGLAVTIGQVIEQAQPHIGHGDWQGSLVGVGRRESLFLAARTLAYMYQQRLPTPLMT